MRFESTAIGINYHPLTHLAARPPPGFPTHSKGKKARRPVCCIRPHLTFKPDGGYDMAHQCIMHIDQRLECIMQQRPRFAQSVVLVKRCDLLHRIHFAQWHINR